MTIKVSILNTSSETQNCLAALIRSTPGLQLVPAVLNHLSPASSPRGGIPHVIVVEPDQRDAMPYQMLTRIRTFSPSVRILVLDRLFSARSVQLAVTAGAHGVISIHTRHNVIVERILQIGSGEVFLDPVALRLLVEALHQSPALIAAQMNLSHREIDVLDGYSQGHRAKEVADALKLSHFTVQSHVRSIYTKLEARSMAHAVALCHPLGRFSIRWLDEVVGEPIGP